MTTSRVNTLWSAIILILLAVILAGGIITCSRFPRSQPLEITPAPEPRFAGDIYVGGEVANPGFYPLRPEDRIADVIGAAGGTTDNAGAGLRLYVAGTEEAPPQRININRAEAWLLEALPGIGEVRARAIVEYRKRNGGFGTIGELTRVDGIGAATYERIKHLIAVAD